jgi:hypothetical protein
MKQRRLWGVVELTGIVIAGGTILLAAVTAGLAWDTHRLASVTYQAALLEHKVVLVRLCDTATREQARDGDGVMDFQPHSPDGFEYSDSVSRDDIMQTYLTNPEDDFVRCEVINYGELPVLQVQAAMTVVGKRGYVSEVRRIETSPFLSIPAGKYATFWFVNNSDVTATLHTIDKVRYQVYETGQTVTLPAEPRLADVWVIRPKRKVIEYLDQRQMTDF